MQFEITLQAMFDFYPTLFKDRSDCLNHLFCTIGNGYKWVNGELVSRDDKYTSADLDKLKSHLVNGKAYQHNKMSLKDEAIYYLKQNILDKIEDKQLSPEAQTILDRYVAEHLAEYPDDVYHRKPRAQRWYLEYCTEYAKLFDCPADIKPDWQAGLEECKAMLREDGFNPDSIKTTLFDLRKD